MEEQKELYPYVTAALRRAEQMHTVYQLVLYFLASPAVAAKIFCFYANVSGQILGLDKRFELTVKKWRGSE